MKLIKVNIQFLKISPAMNATTDLLTYNNSWFRPGSFLKRMSWHYINCIFFKSGIFPFYGLKVFLLKIFGAKVGKSVKIKPFVNIKYPWLLSVEDNVWIGENAWIDNLTYVRIKKNVCISQGAYLLTGNHNYKKKSFDLFLGEIIIEEGVWIGAQSVICPGVICKSHSMLTAGSVATTELEPYYIYGGNPAVKIRPRIIES